MPSYELEKLLFALVASIVAPLAALVAQRLLNKKGVTSERALEEAREIAAAVQGLEAARKAALVQQVTEQARAGLTPAQMQALADQIAGRLAAQQEAESKAASAVEKLVSGYHQQALNQARAQFWFSVVVASVGFFWILYAGLDIKSQDLATISKLIPGTVMDAVAFLFFRQASEIRQRATDLYDRLRKDRQMVESIALVSSIEDLRIRSAVKAQIALHMSGLSPKEIELTSFLTLGVTQDEPPAADPPPPGTSGQK